MTGLGSTRPAIFPAACYLACSWTWVLGMFFPVLMISDFGWPGWVAFAVPNCIGAMSVGFLLRDGNHARRFAREHRWMIAVFSWVTIAFHTFFIAHLGSLFVADPSWLIRGAFFIGAIALLSRVVRPSARGHLRASAPVIALISLGAIVGNELLSTGQSIVLPPSTGVDPPSSLIYAVPALALGFLCCPYLDITFLHVRRTASRAAGRAMFALSFLFVFPLLITCTLLYAQGFLGAAPFTVVLILHFLVQAGFTTGAHGRELTPPHRRIAAACGVGSALIGVLLPHEHFRLAYELFMSAYGLPFPVYLVVFALPWLRRASFRSRVICALISMMLAGPCFWLGYIETAWIWLIPGVIAAVGIPAGFALVTRLRSHEHTAKML